MLVSGVRVFGYGPHIYKINSFTLPKIHEHYNFQCAETIWDMIRKTTTILSLGDDAHSAHVFDYHKKNLLTSVSQL